MIRSYTGQIAVTKLLSSFPWARSSYYYQPHLGQRGRAISPHTLTQTGMIISNEQVVEWIRNLLIPLRLLCV